MTNTHDQVRAAAQAVTDVTTDIRNAPTITPLADEALDERVRALTRAAAGIDPNTDTAIAIKLAGGAGMNLYRIPDDAVAPAALGHLKQARTLNTATITALAHMLNTEAAGVPTP